MDSEQPKMTNKSLSNTQLINAAKMNDCSAIKLALDAGAYVDYRDDSDLNAITIAMDLGSTDAVDILVLAGAKKYKNSTQYCHPDNDPVFLSDREIVAILATADLANAGRLSKIKL